ncbi:MAG: DUF3307 domain-containing protein [Flavobacteriaceae bacterium]|nr:DUF3307 domain-containing protein [Flavobacteriaceae bacterium]
MEVPNIILLQLILAHVLTDFVFQSTRMVEHKRKHKARSWYLYAHSALAGVLTYLLLQQWSQFLVPGIIVVSHFFIDLWKLHQKKDNLKYFLLDQLFHISVLILVWIYLIDGFYDVIPVLKIFFTSKIALAILIGYAVIIFPVGYIIGKATERWQKEIAKETDQESLKKAGRYIGIFERILVLTFILSSNFSAIVFLIGAKSILRFGDVKGARKHTEYVLIGTLMSFAICIIVCLLIRYFILE